MAALEAAAGVLAPQSLRALAELPVRFTQVIGPGEIRAAVLQ